MDLEEQLTQKPHRKIEVIMKLSADNWTTLQNELQHLATEIARHGYLPASSVSGGYSSGHIIVSSVDDSMTHDKWFEDLNVHLEEIRAKESA